VSKEERHIYTLHRNQSINKTRSDKMGDACRVNRSGEKTYKIIIRKPDGK
jgi:hypothetical protein